MSVTSTRSLLGVAATLLLVASVSAGCTSARPGAAPASPSSPTPSAYAAPRTRVGGRILFTIEARNATNKVAWIDAAGLHLVRLAYAGAPGNAVWDGPDRILFHGGSGDVQHVYRARLDGSRVTKLSGGPASQDSPAVSPDGTHIAYGEYRGAQDLGVHQARADGSGGRTLTPPTRPGPSGYDEPSYSPDGRWIAYKHIVNVDQRRSELWVMRADGSGKRRLTSPGTDAGHPRFSPDSSRIMFTEQADADGGVPNVPLWVVDRDGRHLRPVTDPFDPGAAWNGDWSPDGSQVVYMYCRTGWDHNELRVADADGRHVRTLWVSPALVSAESPDWSS